VNSIIARPVLPPPKSATKQQAPAEEEEPPFFGDEIPDLGNAA
jgi:hypothetical protein